MGKAPLRRNQLQQEQRIRTRHLILQASIQVFCQKGYVNTSIEHVLQEANVSRAAFYSHFDGKQAVVTAIAENFIPSWIPIFVDFGAVQNPTLDDVLTWARRYLTHHKDNLELCKLLTQAIVLEQELSVYTSRQRDAVIDILSKQHKAFATTKRCDSVALEAHILLANIEQACFLAAAQHFPNQDDVVVQIMASKMLRFLKRGGQPLTLVED